VNADFDPEDYGSDDESSAASTTSDTSYRPGTDALDDVDPETPGPDGIAAVTTRSSKRHSGPESESCRT
jgi:hypothetical protein